MRPLDPIRALASLIFGFLALGCPSRPDETALQGGAASAVASAALPVVEAGPALAQAEVDAAPPTDPEPPIGEGGTWLESDVYDLKLETVKYCKPPEKTDAATTGVLIGAKVQVKAKTDEFFADARHATLREGGILITPKVDQAFPGCTPPFKGTSLRRGKATSGFIVFEVPAYSPKLSLEFHPQRWGGAGTVRVKLPVPK
jgi:hypothetical protein